jgi:hypothetical protein
MKKCGSKSGPKGMAKSMMKGYNKPMTKSGMKKTTARRR